MPQEKILELGLEGGGATFVREKTKDEEKFIITTVSHDLETGDGSSHQNEFDSFEEAVEAFTKQNPPLLFFYPVYAHPTYKTSLITQLNNEFANMDEQKRKEMFNKGAWEEMLGSTISPENITDNTLVQWFEIRSMEKVEHYIYDYYGDERVLDRIKTIYDDSPNSKFRKQGIGEVKNNTFVIRGGNGKLVGVYSLEQYWVEVVE